VRVHGDVESEPSSTDLCGFCITSTSTSIAFTVGIFLCVVSV
jgi:hypothetical protein